MEWGDRRDNSKTHAKRKQKASIMQRITCEIPSNAQQNSRKILPKYHQITSKTLAKILAKHLQNTSKSLAHY